jgi:tetratricopeptide (TPR) repeat protein
MLYFADSCLTAEPSGLEGQWYKAIGLWIKAATYASDENEEINLLKECKSILDKLLSITYEFPKQVDSQLELKAGLLFFRGVWSFKAATNVSLVDKITFNIMNLKSLPSASIEDAIIDLENAVKLVHLRGAFFVLSKCFLLKKQHDKAREYFTRGLDVKDRVPELDVCFLLDDDIVQELADELTT